jgi:hypothetical protein
MGLIDQKKNIFTTIGAYTSMAQSGTMPNTTNIFPSINNKKDIVPMLLDIMKVVVGTDALQELTGQLFTNFVDKVEPTLKAAVKNQTVQPNSGTVIPDGFKNNGYNIKVKDVDIYGVLKVNPASTSGSMLYDMSKPNFNKLAYQAIQNAGTDTIFGSIIINYNSSTDSFNFKPNLAVTGANPKIGDFLGGFVDSMEIVNKKTFVTDVMNSIYGTISHTQKKTVEQIAAELEINKLIEQLINDDDSFVISPEDYEAILRQAQEFANGVVYYDMGCGVMAASLPLSGLSALITSISGSTDPFFVGNAVNATIEESTKNTPEIAKENKQTVKDGFFQRLIKLITQSLALAVTTTPQIRTLQGIISGFQNNGVVQLGNPKNDLKKFRVYLNCVIKAAMAMINKFIFDLVVTLLNKLLTPVIKAIIKEKINQYVKILQSLIPIKT